MDLHQVVDQLWDELFPELREQSNHDLAQTLVHYLSALFPRHRFMVIVGQQQSSVAVHGQRGIFIDKSNRPFVTVYATFGTDYFEDNTNCYGDIDKRFGCDKNITKILDYIGEVCGPNGGNNPESVGLRGVISDDQFTVGFAWSLPNRAVRLELINRTCDGWPKHWHVVIALMQKRDVLMPFVKRLELQNSSEANCLVPFDEHNGQHQQAPSGLFVAILSMALALDVLLLIAILFISLLLYTLVKRMRHRGSFAFYFKAAWLFGPKLAQNELNSTLIDIEHLIYSGPNSRVYFARYRLSETSYRSVAVKVPSRDAFHLHNIERETRINAQLRHPRVVEYVGFYRDAFDDVRIISEFMAGGDLHTFLMDKRNTINVGHIFNFISQIAEGMEYLIQKRLIHRDLAARNCMLSEEGTSIKIADFGLSRHFNAGANYSSSNPVRLPLRWMAMECFDENGQILHQCKFNEKTDVWSYGIVVWECFSRGAQPYGSNDVQQVIAELKKHFNGANANAISNGGISAARGTPICRSNRLGCPEKCPQMLYDQLMLKCWADNSEMRPTFSAIRAKLDEIFSTIVAICPDTLIQIVQ